MPELPEVETVKRGLENYCLNKTISSVVIHHDNIIANIAPIEFINKTKNQTIKSFSRKGKFLIINLNEGTLLVHLRMEGKFKFEKELIDKHSHVIFTFTDDNVLIYHDVRKFGKIYYFDKEVDIYKEMPLVKLGLEPMEITETSYLYNKFKKVNLPIKAALLEQSIIAGIGNIYADEICFACKISPFKKASELTISECENIVKEASRILTEAIKLGGSTIKSFQSTHGVDGLFQQKLLVYGKQSVPCINCNTPIEKTFVKQRGTHYCPNCQKG